MGVGGGNREGAILHKSPDESESINYKFQLQVNLHHLCEILSLVHNFLFDERYLIQEEIVI